MRTRNSYFPNNSSVIIPRRRNKRRTPNVVEPELRTIVEMADNRTMEELLQAPTEGYGEAIVIPEINADHFEIKTNLLQLEDLVNKFVNQFFPPSKTTHLKNEISRFTQRFEETFGEAWERFKEMLRACPHNGFTKLAQIDTFYNGLNDNDQDSLNAATVNASKSDDRIDMLADQISTLVDIFTKKIVAPAPVKAVEESCVTCGGAHAHYNYPNTDSNQPSVCVPTGEFKNEIQNTMKTQQTVLMEQQNAFQNDLQNMLSGFFQNQSSTSGTLPSNIIPNPKGEMKAITTRSGVAYKGPSIPTPKKVVEQESDETTDKEQSNFQGSAAYIQPSVTLISEPDVPKTLPKPKIPYPSRLNDQKLREKATNQMDKFFQIFQDLHFDISFVDALILMPKFASTIKSLLTNKDKLFELAKIPLNENCSAMLLKELPEKLGDPGKFLFHLSLPELTPTRMTLELADRSITHPKGVAKDIFVKVGKFQFPTDFVVVDFQVDPFVPLILGRSFLRTGRALIDVYGEEITLRVNDEAVTFNLNQTTRYSSTYDDFNSSGGNPTSTFEPILFYSSPSLTLFEGSDFIDAYLKDESISPEIDHADCDPEGDIFLIEKLLNDDPF
uniref:Reverse transcriptase domain-containing protein n=1 Tax=Tanacetum cinerariifolium TaxID=118510 RepID=A0A699JGU0_TANCI|nr:reverse transcriptase domain-containing protein [Tanacetum cinerariifolium]